MNKKTFLFLISFILICCHVYSQQADTLNKSDKDGKKQGYWKKVDEKGHLKYEGYFINNNPTGLFKYYNEEGNLTAISNFFEKGLRSFTKTYYPNGNIMSEGYYVSTHKDSTWKYFNINGIVIREEFYRANLKNGEWKTYYEDGSLMDKTNWKNGKKDGPWEQTYSGGSLKTQFNNNKLEGNYQVFNPDGRIRYIGKYVNNLKEGIWFWYSSYGIPNKKLTYRNDKLISKELIFYENKKPFGISFDSIAYVYMSSGNSQIKRTNNTIYQTTTKFAEIVELLGIDNFILINKNFMANYASIKGISPFTGGFYKVYFHLQPDFEVIAEEESSKGLKLMFPDIKKE
ncbi:MAG: LytTR family transcriptional regulator DNA-binding domain-containing protein [Bacteroidetes bacterium]|nr:LytTR family transcriptional regulator DNA-binding domain-containing protein [Bacteroidota bacterium]